MNKDYKKNDLKTNIVEYSVTQLSTALKHSIEENYSWVRVRGEVSGFKKAASGHLYFSVKDEQSVLDAVCWRGLAGKLQIMPEDGLEVIISGKLTTYSARSRYQLVVQAVEVAGEGALLKLLEDRKNMLANEGLFDEIHKQSIPFVPTRIGVVTSPTGAVIRDIIHRIRERYPCHILVWPVLVQGDSSAAEVAEAIRGFNTLSDDGKVPRPDLLIVARGGGSLEDLWTFNEEIVVRAAANSKIPLISAIGHETDTTLLDLVADRRAPTPSAAAEMAVPVRLDLLESILSQERRLMLAAGRLIQQRRTQINGLGRGLPDASLTLGTAEQRVDDLGTRLLNSINSGIKTSKQVVETLGYRIPRPREYLSEKSHKLGQMATGLQPRAIDLQIRQFVKELTINTARLDKATQRRFIQYGEKLESLFRLLNNFSYTEVLERGFVLVRDESNNPISSVDKVSRGMHLTLDFYDGKVTALSVKKEQRALVSSFSESEDDQNSLL